MKFWLYLGIYILVMGFLNIEGPNRTRERGFIGHIKKAICNTQNLLSKLFSKGSNGEYDEDDEEFEYLGDLSEEEKRKAKVRDLRPKQKEPLSKPTKEINKQIKKDVGAEIPKAKNIHDSKKKKYKIPVGNIVSLNRETKSHTSPLKDNLFDTSKNIDLEVAKKIDEAIISSLLKIIIEDKTIKLLSSSEEVKDPTTGELKIKVDGEEFKLMVIGNQQTDIENKSNSDIIIDYSNFYSQEEIVDSYLQWSEE